MRVLIVEDELFLAEALQAGLRHEAIAADIALDGDAALDRLAANDYDVIISAETLLEKAWDENANPFTSASRVTISTLRRPSANPT